MSILAPKAKNMLRDFACLAILFTINLLNYMDRYTVAGKFKSLFVRPNIILFLSMHVLVGDGELSDYG